MINLPHKLDLIKVTGKTGSGDSQYRYNARFTGDTSPSNLVIPKGEYALLDSNRIIFSKTDILGSDPSFSATVSVRVRIRQTSLGYTQDAIYSGTLHVYGGYYLFVSTISANSFGLGNTGDVIMVFDRVEPAPSLVGEFSSRMDCYVTQLARSLDEEYFERYMVITNTIVDNVINTLYVIPVQNEESGLSPDIVGARVERQQSWGNISNLIIRPYPEILDPPAISPISMTYTDITDSSKTISIPRTIAE